MTTEWTAQDLADFEWRRDLRTLIELIAAVVAEDEEARRKTARALADARHRPHLVRVA